jgi:hypothetical protein
MVAERGRQWFLKVNSEKHFISYDILNLLQ